MSMKLHCFGESGNAYKAALTLALSGADWTSVYVDFFNGGTRTPEFRELNVMGEVPVLEDGTTVLTQSGVIQDYVAEKTGKLGGESVESRRAALRWVLFDNHKISGVAGPLRFNENFLAPDKRNADVNAFMLMRLTSALKILDTQLSQTPFLTGETLTIADIACCGYLYYPEPYGFDRTAFRGVDAWLTRISETPGWAHPYDLMPGSPADRA